MKKIIALAIVCCCAATVRAQQFKPKFTLPLPDSILRLKADWADLDNDGLLDIVLMVKNDRGEGYLMFVKGDTVNTPMLRREFQNTITMNAYTWVDYNRDNAMDLVISGTRSGIPATVLYQNRGGFRFDEVQLSMPGFSKSLFADLNNDARAEWVMTGRMGAAPYLLAFSQNAAGSWEPMTDTVAMEATAIEIADADRNGIQDLFVSGRIGTDSLFTGFLVAKGDTALVPHLGYAWIGNAALADLNADGVTDVVFGGTDTNGHRVEKIWTSSTSSFTLSDALLSLSDARFFIADLDADGRIDQSVSGQDGAGHTRHLVRYATADVDTLDTRRVAHHAFGDAEHDGDLDVLQVVMDQTPVLRLLENYATPNKAPAKPLETVSFRIYDRIFVHWNVPTDDHTPGKSLTYDVFFQAQGREIQAGDFDLASDKRLLTRPGNNGTYNFKLLKDISPGTFNYIVQAVDNSLHAHAACFGAGGGSCAIAEPQVVTTCSTGQVELPGSVGTKWFSFASGYLGELASLQLEPQKQDTVFSYDPSLAGCDALRTYIIEIKDTIQAPAMTRYACQNTTISLDAGAAGQPVQWTSLLKGDLGSSPILSYLVQQRDSLLAITENAQGCKVSTVTAVVPSIPPVAVLAGEYKIVQGTGVQLLASGAERYAWTPSTGLDRADIPNPVARPDVTTQYDVTGYDSLGCFAVARVVITVEGSGFIPNLFTPNGDGQNDQLKVYGLTTATGFLLTISNREGSIVFRTSDIVEASSRGWDGTDRGVKQPGGVYFWKVKGQTADGGKLLLNGKESGSLVLIH